MKYIKTYEDLNIYKEPKIGDYVICTTNDTTSPGLKEFLEQTIGKCINTNFNFLIIEYQYVPNEILYTNFDLTTGKIRRGVMKDDVLYYSPNKEELEIYLNANKYNL